jgi:hypothetical protein
MAVDRAINSCVFVFGLDSPSVHSSTCWSGWTHIESLTGIHMNEPLKNKIALVTGGSRHRLL